MKYCQNEKCQKIKNDLAFLCGKVVGLNESLKNELLAEEEIPTECEWIVEISRRYQNA